MARIALLLTGLAALAATPVVAGSVSPEFDKPGNILITDQFNNRVIEIDRHKKIVWQFGSGNPKDCTPGASSVIAPNDAERLAGGLTLIAGTGTGTCPDNRVFVVNASGAIVWQYGQAGVTGRGPNELNVPVFAIQTRLGDYLITDQANNRLIQVDASGNKLWSYAPKTGTGALNSPNSAEVLRNGHILVADENNNRVLEITRKGDVVNTISAGLNTVAFASRLPNGDTLIADSGNNRVVEFDSGGNVVFNYATNTDPDSNPNPNPTGAIRLGNGNTLIADQFNDRVIEVTPAGSIVSQYGKTNKAGTGPDHLNAPYSAVMIGQYIGVTKPPQP
jgi:sugar lactone lactonase YvrE